ncbi:MAG TPA: hypothetical protein VLB44_05640, partial [Kofleriaceae bacterium]|nr:hypothetical protein [Kofleriaceae bacterium]
VEEIGAVSARIVDEDADPRTGVPARTLALGGGEYLRVELRTRVERDVGDEPESGPVGHHRARESAEDMEGSGPHRRAREIDIEAAFERVTRQLRAIRRRYEVARLPEMTIAPGTVPPGGKVIERIESYMKALAQIDRASNAFVTKGTQLIACANKPDDLEASRWPFLARRALATHAPGSSHGEIVDPDAYAMSFWYDAALVILLDEPYGVDFVRHRCRQVARELCNLLPLLDPDPEAPAAIGPRPRRPTQQ